MLGELFEGMVAIWVIDKVTGKRKKVYVKNNAEKKRLMAQNKKLKAELAQKKNKKSKK